MNNTDWKILIYLREERSINKVAKRLFMTQPSLTYRLDQMEKEIGVPLFIRTNKGVHFTDAGDRLFSYAEKELQRYQDMKNFVTHEPNTISGVLRIGATRSFTQSHMPTLLKGFVDKYNDIDLSLTTSSSDQLIKLIKKEDIQLAIVRGNPEWPELDVPLANPAGRAPFPVVAAEHRRSAPFPPCRRRLPHLHRDRKQRPRPLHHSRGSSAEVRSLRIP